METRYIIVGEAREALRIERQATLDMLERWRAEIAGVTGNPMTARTVLARLTAIIRAGHHHDPVSAP